ncbi:PTS transporter subunit EIIC [Phaeacidiphilus oryzae]|uniref:PTS transporter subunit EIIC n=1 Tax=Phaeacidiphilus oryzae TaxID=348818 RepID=UPI0005685720|nr:PTS transporter subunit EIIC [Phaeacidiphilus oryzae]
MSASSATAPSGGRHFWQSFYNGLQKMGRSLQVPIAVLPAAGILNRLGQPDIFGTDGLGWDNVAKVLAGAGSALLDSSLGLPLLFCVGVAIGMAKKSDGSTGLAAVAAFLVYYTVLHQFPQDCPAGQTFASAGLGGVCVDPHGTAAPATYQNPSVFGGIILGLLTSWFWVRYHRTKLVDWLGFFNGRRLVPIIMSAVAICFAVLCLLIWGPIGDGLQSFAQWMSDRGSIGSGIYGVANRALLTIGMHQFLNTFLWFQFGSFTKGGVTYNGDITRFLHGDPTAGQFQSGFFPIMMFALPAAAMAIARCAKPHRRKEVTGMMISMALTSLVTGVTEPIEYSFLYVAPALYGIHALLTGVSMGVTWALGVHAGFSFSAGLIDYVINWSLATKPWLILPIGACFAAVYYFLFLFVIKRFDLKTPGREDEDESREASITKD